MIAEAGRFIMWTGLVGALGVSLSWTLARNKCRRCGANVWDEMVWVLTEPGEVWDLVDCGSCRP